MRSCVWYVSSSVKPWEKFMIGSMASALKGAGVDVVLCSDGGTAGLDFFGAPMRGSPGGMSEVVSWRSLTLPERIGRVFIPHAGRLWHLWGEPPAWWGIVRSHSRTFHTSFDEHPQWRGHPSRIFRTQADGGESVISPTFSSAVPISELPYGSECRETREGERTADAQRLTVYADASCGIAEIHDAGHRETNEADRWDIREVGVLLPDRADTISGVLVEGSDSPLAAIRAAALTMRGLSVVSVSSPYMDELLGSDGYIRISCDDDIGAAIRKAVDRGAAARHFINVHMSAELCADSLKAMYMRACRWETRETGRLGTPAVGRAES